MIRKFALALVVVALGTASASAGQVTGSAAFGGGVSSTADIDLAGSVNVIGLSIGFEAATGDYVGRPAGLIGGAGVLNFTIGSAYTFGSAAFGTFTGVVAYDDNSAPDARTIYLSGTFTAGTDPIFVGKTDPTSATVILGFTQAGGSTNSISIAGTLVTPAIRIPGAPEPTTIATALMGLAFAGFAARRRLAK